MIAVKKGRKRKFSKWKYLPFFAIFCQFYANFCQFLSIFAISCNFCHILLCHVIAYFAYFCLFWPIFANFYPFLPVLSILFTIFAVLCIHQLKWLWSKGVRKGKFTKWKWKYFKLLQQRFMFWTRSWEPQSLLFFLICYFGSILALTFGLQNDLKIFYQNTLKPVLDHCTPKSIYFQEAANSCFSQFVISDLNWHWLLVYQMTSVHFCHQNAASVFKANKQNKFLIIQAPFNSMLKGDNKNENFFRHSELPTLYIFIRLPQIKLFSQSKVN